MACGSARNGTPGSRTALSVEDDPRDTAARLLALHEAWRTSEIVPGEVRPAVARAWRRLSSAKTAPVPRLVDEDVRDRRAVRTTLAALVPGLQATLLDVAAEASNELVVCDADGYVLWLDGPRSVRRHSERLGFVEGACWREDTVGANALGTALVDGEPVQIFGAEHTDEGHHAWVCTGAPIVDPASGTRIGAVTLSGPLRSAHPNTLALVSAATRSAQALLAGQHRERLRTLAADADDREGIVVDPHGWVATSPGFRVGERLWLPGPLREGTIHVPGLGAFDADPVGPDGAGWRLRPRETVGPTRIELTTGPETTAVIVYPDRRDVAPITPRQAVVLAALAEAPQGLTAADLAEHVYGSRGRAVTARADMSRLRHRLGDVVGARPYRLTVPLVAGGVQRSATLPRRADRS